MRMKLAATGNSWRQVADDIGVSAQVLYNFSSNLRPWPEDILMAASARLGLLKKFREVGIL
jgi:hypothetical protein